MLSSGFAVDCDIYERDGSSRAWPLQQLPPIAGLNGSWRNHAHVKTRPHRCHAVLEKVGQAELSFLLPTWHPRRAHLDNRRANTIDITDAQIAFFRTVDRPVFTDSAGS